jgi:N-acetyl sugar amidotransferase
MNIAYVCTNYNNSAFTASAVASLMKNRGHAIRAYVVDNASRHEEVEILRALERENPAVCVIASPTNMGYFAGLNLGLKAAREGSSRTDWIVTGNNDLLFPPDFCDRLESQQAHYCQYSVVAPDIVTQDGEHQNPHVISGISRIREVFYDLHYSNYYLGSLIYKAAKLFPRITRRGDEDEWRTARLIYEGHGSCFLLTPKFFAQFDGLWAPTFMMAEELFLTLQLRTVGEEVYYSPAIRVTHCWHGALQKVPGRHRWEMARAAHSEYRKYIKVFNATSVSSPRLSNSRGANVRKYQLCSHCVMDTTDSAIVFDKQGVCDHCNTFYKKIEPNWHTGERGERELRQVVEDIKAAGKGKDYDCIIGMSGGIDSSYLTYIATEIGLRPLVFHVDAGWNSQEAVNNIEKLIGKLGLDLFTEVIDWEEMRDLQLAFFKAGVPHIDAPQDHAFFATMYKFAEAYDIKYILTGANYSTECIRNPIEWMYYQSDSIQLRDIHKRFGTRQLKKFPTTSIFRHKIWLPYFKQIKVVNPLNNVEYNKAAAVKLLTDKFGWQVYPQKHFESRFTRFYEGYWLPRKFGFDTRKVQFSSLILTGQMTREEALERLKSPALGDAIVRQECEYVANKLKISIDELQSYMDAPNKSYEDYRSQEVFYRLGARAMKAFGLELGGKR